MVNHRTHWLKLSIAVLVFSSYMGLATTFRYSQMSAIVPLTVILTMPLGEWMDRTFSVYRKVTNVTSVAVLLMLPVIALQSGLMDTVIALFIYIQIYSLGHQKQRQEYYHVILMCFFLLVAALVMSPSAVMGLVLFFFILSGATSLLLTDWRGQIIESTPVVPDSRMGGRSLKHVSAQKTRMASATALLLMAILGMTSVFFIFLPRTQAGLLGRSIPSDVYTTGLSDGIQLDVNGSIANDSSPVMRVQFQDVEEGRYEEEKYWRSTSMDKYNGNSWARQGLATRRSNGQSLNGFRTVSAGFGVNTGVVRATLTRDWPEITYEVFVDSYPEGGFPLLSTVRRVAPKNRTRNLRMYWEQGGDFTVNLNYRNEMKPYFVATSQLVNPSPEQLRNSDETYMDHMVLGDYNLLTEHNLNRQSLNLVNQITQGAATAFDKASAIENYLIGPEFEYTRQVPALDPESPVESFIHDAKAGHCELFASAMALMVRSLDIPARVVSGYRGGDWDESDTSYTITNSMAHLWVEVYFPDYGWITFDPTPSDADLERTAYQQFMITLARYSFKARIFWLQYVVGFSPTESATFLRDQAFAIIQDFFSSESEEDEGVGKLSWPSGTRGVLFTVFLIALSGTLVLGAYILIRAIRRPSGRSLSADQAKARKLYRRLQKVLFKFAVVGQNETAEELSAGLECFPASVRDELREFVDRYHDARFGARPLSSHESTRFNTLIQNLKRPAILSDPSAS